MSSGRCAPSRAGKHVLCEKPFSRHSVPAEQAFAYAESEGLVLSEGFMWRHHPQAAKLAEVIANGAIGRLRLVRVAFSFPLAVEQSRGCALPREPRRRSDDGRRELRVECDSLPSGRTGERLREAGSQPSRGRRLRGNASARWRRRLTFRLRLRPARRSELEVLGEEGSLFVTSPFVITQPGIELVGTERSSGSGSRRSTPIAWSSRT